MSNVHVSRPLLALMSLLVCSAPALPFTIPECPRDHKCSCMARTESVQNQQYLDCVESNRGRKNMVVYCASKVPRHCELIERYGNWHRDESGSLDMGMPQQCAEACLRAHCKCQTADGGEVCHLSHLPKDDR